MLLGGSYGQLPAIHVAKERGLHTILCDYLSDNPGRQYVDEFYLESSTNTERILALAKSLEIDCLLGYASDPAAPTVAKVSETLGLPCANPFQSVEILCYKDRFRQWQKEAGFNHPSFIVCDSIDEVSMSSGQFSFPLIVKPIDSSDTKGISLIDNVNELEGAFLLAKSFSRAGKVILEEFIDDSLANFHGDALFDNGNMVYCMLGDRLFTSESSPLKPSTESYPSKADPIWVSKAEKEVERTLQKVGFKHGCVNIEARVHNNGEVYIMEIGPRSGGGHTPYAIALSSGFNMLEATFDLLLGNPVSQKVKSNFPVITFELHYNSFGTFKQINIPDHWLPYIVFKKLSVVADQKIVPFSEPSSSLGTLMFQFPSWKIRDEIASTMYEEMMDAIKVENDSNYSNG